MKFVWEHNGNDTLLYSVDCVGAYTRGESLDAALGKVKAELAAYAAWSGQAPEPEAEIEIVQEKHCDLQICDADSDVIFDSEKLPLSREEYLALKELVLKSAQDFHTLYLSIPNKQESCLPHRATFYGKVPRTAEEMYEHTKSVNAYYFGEIGIDADNDGTIFECRNRGFEKLEQTAGFLENPVEAGSYGESWSLRKLLRRFLWHDRIHAKAMVRMAVKTFGAEAVQDPFQFPLSFET